jgi:nitrate/nitrite transport system ATP-binding protein
MAKYVSVEGIARRYPGATIFEDLWLDVKRGEFVCLVGHSGCGKTTVLNILAGLEAPSEGGVIVDGQEITGPSLDRAVIFQGHALMPWMTAEQNVAFALSCRHPSWPKARLREEARKALEKVGLGHAAEKKPAQLSGGMKQRVGIACAGDRAQDAADGRALQRARCADARRAAGRGFPACHRSRSDRLHDDP